MLGIFTALKTKVPIDIGITLVNDCFQCKNNEADGVFWQTLFSYLLQTTQQTKYTFRGILDCEV
jgi:hypothetical protein